MIAVANAIFLALGLFLVVSAVLGFVLVRRREWIEQLFTVYSSAGKWAEALPHAILLARLLRLLVEPQRARVATEASRGAGTSHTPAEVSA